VEKLSALVAPSVDNLTVLWDHNRNGHWWNYERALETLIDSAKPGEPVLIMTDDATTVPDWRERWERIHAQAQDQIYVLFGRQKHLFTPENVARGYVTKVQPKGYYDQAAIFIDQHGLMGRIREWLAGPGRSNPVVMRRGKWLDVMVQEYLIQHRIPWTIATPSLFDHAAIASTLGHDVGGSPCYVGSM
jgi:hypothetical protein